MITEYSYDNIEAMINSIQSNAELISNMVETTKNNDKLISNKLTSYANNKGALSQDQILLYKNYVENKEEVESELNTYSKEVENIGGIRRISMQICNENQSFKSIHEIFNRINTLQIKIMEMLCSIIGHSNMVMAAI